MNLIFIIILAISVHVSAHEAGETQAQIGPGKAVEAVDPKSGIKLSEKARKMLEIQVQKVISTKELTVPRSAILMIQAKSAVYVLREGWFKLIDISAQDLKNGNFRVSSNEIKQGDEIVTHGSALIRVAQMNVAVEDEHEEEGHHSDEENHEGHDD